MAEVLMAATPAAVVAVIKTHDPKTNVYQVKATKMAMIVNGPATIVTTTC